jgi:hypothetical protein
MSLVASRAPGAPVFFDARRAPEGLFEREALHGILAIYCREREADAFILDAVRDAADPNNVLVVSNDRQITGTARQHGAKTSGIDDFFRERRKVSAPHSAHLETRRHRYVKFDFKPEDFGLPDEVDLENPDID